MKPPDKKASIQTPLSENHHAEIEADYALWRMKDVAEQSLKRMCESEGFVRMANGPMSQEHYKSLLRQLFHHSKERSRILSHAASYLRGYQRDAIQTIYNHAARQAGCNNLALNDLRELGENIEGLPYQYPHPSTLALTSYAFYQIQIMNPIGFLGHVYYLEFFAKNQSKHYLQILETVGIPNSAMSFMKEPPVIDVGHMDFLMGYIQKLVTNCEDLEAVLFSIRVTAKLYGDMVTEAFRAAELPSHNWGYDYQEIKPSRDLSYRKVWADFQSPDLSLQSGGMGTPRDPL